MSSTDPKITPKIAVVMPSFNAGSFLTAAVKSVLAQTFADFEFIIIDDASTDGTRDAIMAWGRRDARIRVVLNETNLGLAASANRGIAMARADWIARMDADDLSLPRRLEKQYAAAQAQPAAGFITSLLESVDSSGRIVAKARKGVMFQPELLPWFLLFYNRVGGHGQVMFNRETILGIGGYDESNRASQDRDLWPRLLRQGPCIALPEVLYQWRADNLSSITHALRFRYAESSLEVDRREIATSCGLAVTREEAMALRDFWLRFHAAGQDWDAVQRRLLELAERFTPPRPVPGLRHALRRSIACGWLANGLRAARMRDGALWRGHLRRSREAAGTRWPLAWLQFARELASVGGEADRLV